MKTLRAADSADAIVDSLRWRRAEVYVPSSLRPLSVLDLALPRRIKRISPAHVPQRPDRPRADPAARADYQVATRRPVPDLVAEALTNDETAERRVISLATANTHAPAASFSDSTHAAAASSSSSPMRADSSAATRSARTTNALLPSKRPGERPPDARNGRFGREEKARPESL